MLTRRLGWADSTPEGQSLGVEHGLAGRLLAGSGGQAGGGLEQARLPRVI